MGYVLLIRHGRTTANANGILAGWTPNIRLDHDGETAATALGQALTNTPVTQIVASPLQRCQQTAKIIATTAWPHLAIDTDEQLGECHYGQWTGKPINELTKLPLWQQIQQQPSAVTFPHSDTFAGEGLAHMSARVIAAVRHIDHINHTTNGPESITVVVSHGDPIKAVLADAAGAHLDTFQRLHVTPTSTSLVQYTDSKPLLHAINIPPSGVAETLRRIHTAPTHVPTGDGTIGGGA
ncbi:MSMEG_4193 family putative phosphomutase [Dermatophilus congolensis]|uniref:MSMEG_4193 family putative phosphomutase n=1 Tax=Dermatophilus congolensis TaxID=1863 RepID=UPI001AAE3BCA|nr:MSMEG_4193 family putative phosphomutase [Dermatophilus congolensis]MBO3142856.1 MSMEG_4193 family putative phosphomutase [Dermatophilus congolensis]MBO3151848.1 MSMEG_4193 family putative phosphomutase [Dermatophilus congolensis]MBO3161148.1 MSMEG_4193 family putative phosphomutase [Dermatophilus congolensis]MBO3163131.1 MSMEG_4193 family putative phosphomutase [Dermatophilus congolensis]MBO3176686.1 MSMEG_4193 family putative phosphomutase [Dermatophilus congolensis]